MNQKANAFRHSEPSYLPKNEDFKVVYHIKKIN